MVLIPTSFRHSCVRVTLFAIVIGLSTFADAAPRVWHVGFLSGYSQEALRAAGGERSFIEALRKRGYVEGRNLVVEWRFADGDFDRLPDLAADLVRRKVDIIVASPSPAIRAAQRATSTIPIVFPATGDPVGSGFAASLGRPGGNVTGLSNANVEISPKLVELLKTTVPGMTKVAILANPESSTEAAMVKSLGSAAREIGVSVLVVEARNVAEIDRGFDTMARERVDALLVASDGFMYMQRSRIATLALEHRLPSVSQVTHYARDGGLMTYRRDESDTYQRTAALVDRILRGAKPADLPIEQPTKFVLQINLRTAHALGLTIPPAVRLRADEIFQ